MEQLSDAGMLAALTLGPGSRIAVIDGFVHGDGILYLAAAPEWIDPDGWVDESRLRTATSPTGARVLTVHTSPSGTAVGVAADIPVARPYEAVLNATLVAECDGLILHSGASKIILTRTEVRVALIRRQRLATKAARLMAELPRLEPTR